MFPRIQGLFTSMTDKRSHDCDANRLTIHRNIEDDSSDASSGENVRIEDKGTNSSEETSLQPVPEDHSSLCQCPNCDEILSKFSECSICLEPLQTRGPCMCPRCGGLWCWNCSRRLSRCAWCRAVLPTSIKPCIALQRLVRNLSLPCRNYRRGCTELLTAATRPKHEEECKFDSMMCPVMLNCCSLPFEEISAHLLSNHSIIAIYSQKIKILIENFQWKLKRTACCKTKYKVVLLYQKSAFIIKVRIYNYHVRVEVMRKMLGYVADKKSETRNGEYCALIEFQSEATYTKSAILVENETYGKKAEIRWQNNPNFTSLPNEAITIHVNIGKPDAETLSMLTPKQ